MPRSTAPVLRQAGHEAEDVRDIGLRGAPDAEVFATAQERQATLVTADLGFANILQFPLGTHAGIIVARVPDTLPTSTLLNELVLALQAMDGEALPGLLVLVEPGRIRVRRPPTRSPA